MTTNYIFGEIRGNPEGTQYANRDAAMAAGVHQVNMQGISGNCHVGANSIVVNGGYEDDEDLGSEILYTGAGGNDPRTKKQIANQTFNPRQNAGLVVSEQSGLPVRVLRGHRGQNNLGPEAGFRYDGLFRVDSHWYEPGKSGFRVCRFRLIKLTMSEAAPYRASPEVGRGLLAEATGETAFGHLGHSGSVSSGGATGSDPGSSGTGPGTPPVGTNFPGHNLGVIKRVIRDTSISNWVEALYDHRCQICGIKLALPFGDYAEGAHIRALGKPHHGPDIASNTICLCPNHHVPFDKGAIYLSDEFNIHDYQGDPIGSLDRHASHKIDLTYAQYHRSISGH